jgi:hypothetical protein
MQRKRWPALNQALREIADEREAKMLQEELKLYAQARESITMEVFALILAHKIKEAELNRFILLEKGEEDALTNDK